MKRSEMVLKIASEVVIHDHTITFDKAQDLAEVILGEIEEAGMLPPDKRPASSQLTTKDWKIERDMWVQKTFAWEPEDE